jgi:hypothetical protein
MHACIAALSSGVPVLPIAYSRKFRGVFGSLGYPIIADCRSEAAEQIVAKAIETFAGSERAAFNHGRSADPRRRETGSLRNIAPGLFSRRGRDGCPISTGASACRDIQSGQAAGE